MTGRRRISRAALAGAAAVGLGLPATASPAGAAGAGDVLAFGSAGSFGSLDPGTLNQPVVGIAATPDGQGYYMVAADGGVFTFGDARFQGSTGALRLNAPVVGMAVDPATGGYWLVASDGGVFSFDAPFYGSMGGTRLNRPVVGIAATPGGHGYYLVASDGGVFTFGDARFQGSTGALRLNAPVVGMAVDAATGGYWLAASDGGVFSFDAPFLGSAGGTRLNRPVVGMAATPAGDGYWLAASDGGIFTYGRAPFEGSGAGAPLPQPVVGIAAAGPAGYWLAEGGRRLAGRVIVLDPGHNGGNAADPSFINTPVFNGRAWEPCDTTGTATDAGYPESLFNFDVAGYAAADLRALGATVILTRTTNDGVGPCVTDRAAIGNQAHADAAVSIHADGGPPDGRGVAILEPVPDGPNDGVIASSASLGADLRDAFVAGTGEPVSSYDGVDGIQPRDDLAGTNLTTVPKVFIECANMRNATDAALLENPAWQQQAGQAIANGIADFVAPG